MRQNTVVVIKSTYTRLIWTPDCLNPRIANFGSTYRRGSKYFEIEAGRMNIPYDKRLHFAAGAAIATVVVLVTDSLALAGAAVLLAGIGKELYDACYPDTNTVDVWDVVATCAGWIPVALVVQMR